MDLRFADLHQHILWGIDDGPQTPKAMFHQLELACQNGIDLIAATCHAHPQMKAFNRALYDERLREANDFCIAKGWPLRLVQGCEIYDSHRAADLLREGALPTIGDSRFVLIEFSERVTIDEIIHSANRLYQAGFWPIIAHIERYRCLLCSPKRAMEMREELDVLYQMNCDTIIHPRGFRERRFVEKMLRFNAIDIIATDAHNVSDRSIHMKEAYEIIAQRNPAFAKQLIEKSRRILSEK